MEAQPIQHESSETKGAFYLEVEGKREAEMTYSKAGDTMIIIDHTEVSDAYRGTGVGETLVRTAVEHARKTGIKILALCPFAKSVFDKTPELRDVL